MPSPLLWPTSLLFLMIALTGVAIVISTVSRRSRERRIRALAREWDMQYSRRDVFNLASRVASRLPVPGAADVRVRDLIYGVEHGGHRCIFSAEYTAGVVRSKTRRQCVLSVLEARGCSASEPWTSFQIAAEELPLDEQYRSLRVNRDDSKSDPT